MNNLLSLPADLAGEKHPDFAAKVHPAPALDPGFNFTLPPELEANEPPEARGLRRDAVRLMVSTIADDHITHTRFYHLPKFLNPGDLLVINTSGTLKAALPARRANQQPLVIHLSTRLPGHLWLVELRQPTEQATRPFLQASAGETLSLPAGASLTILTPYLPEHRSDPAAGVRLWLATLHLPGEQRYLDYLEQHGAPIRYSYVKEVWPIEYYQTVYAAEPGSAEMPSAGRAFTPELLTRLVAKGVQVAPLILHTGVASLEKHEPPYEEYYQVSEETARQVNSAVRAGKRVIAVGTTAVRALETVTDRAGVVHPGSGWTRLVIDPRRRLRVVDGLLTGLHEPQATHLAMLQALAGSRHLRHTYTEALRQRYLWHEFGDLHLLLP